MGTINEIPVDESGYFAQNTNPMLVESRIGVDSPICDTILFRLRDYDDLLKEGYLDIGDYTTLVLELYTILLEIAKRE